MVPTQRAAHLQGNPVCVPWVLCATLPVAIGISCIIIRTVSRTARFAGRFRGLFSRTVHIPCKLIRTVTLFKKLSEFQITFNAANSPYNFAGNMYGPRKQSSKMSSETCGPRNGPCIFSKNLRGLWKHNPKRSEMPSITVHTKSL